MFSLISLNPHFQSQSEIAVINRIDVNDLHALAGVMHMDQMFLLEQQRSAAPSVNKPTLVYTCLPQRCANRSHIIDTIIEPSQLRL